MGSFVPHPFARGGHLQTLAGRMGYDTPAVGSYAPTKRHYIRLDDDDSVYFDIDTPEAGSPDNKPIVALFHGLAGCAESSYNLRIASKLNRHGYAVARFSHRGCGPLPEFIARNIYHSGSFRDLFAALKYLKEEFPDREILAVGFSLSGTILLNMLGRIETLTDDLPNLTRALAVCPPIDLERSSQVLSRRINVVYDQYFTRLLTRQIRAREKQFSDVEKTRFPWWVSLRDFDEIFTARNCGFADREDYYTRCSPITAHASIATQTTILAATDDPVVDTTIYNELAPNPQVTHKLSPHGGHMGFIAKDKTEYGDFRWLDLFVVNWVQNNEIQ